MARFELPVTRRDLFAAEAMAAIIPSEGDPVAAADQATAYADALVARLARPPVVPVETLPIRREPEPAVRVFDSDADE